MLDKITENESLESAITDLLSKTANSVEGPSQDFSLFLAIANAQRANLQDERERLRFGHIIIIIFIGCILKHLYTDPSYKKHVSCSNKNGDNIENSAALCRKITYNFLPKTSR